jgi:hypothetical protein
MQQSDVVGSSGREVVDKLQTGRSAAAPEPIDVVYTWVDGADPSFRRLLQQTIQAYSPPILAAATSRQRFRDSGELRYSLRSLQAFVPWVRHVYLVTNGQIPPWLDTCSDRISVVTHGTIFSDRSCLPSFNSNAIEMHLHRIPQISQRFLYLNDDLFFGRPVRRSDFLPVSGGQCLYFVPVPVPHDPNAGLVHDRSFAYTFGLVERLWGPPRWRFLPAHVPQLYDRNILAHLESLLPGQFAETSAHRFRSPDDLVLNILYAYYLLQSSEQAAQGHEARLLQYGSSEHSHVMLVDHPLLMWRELLRVRKNRPRFFAFNDDLGEVEDDHIVLRSMCLLLRWYFPRPSMFERR